jgi:hypothetical protein
LDCNGEVAISVEVITDHNLGQVVQDTTGEAGEGINTALLSVVSITHLLIDKSGCSRTICTNSEIVEELELVVL